MPRLMFRSFDWAFIGVEHIFHPWVNLGLHRTNVSWIGQPLNLVLGSYVIRGELKRRWNKELHPLFQDTGRISPPLSKIQRKPTPAKTWFVIITRGKTKTPKLLLLIIMYYLKPNPSICFYFPPKLNEYQFIQLSPCTIEPRLSGAIYSLFLA